MTVTPQVNAVKPLVNQLDDEAETIIPEIHASFGHVIDEKHFWIYLIRKNFTLSCRCSRREFQFGFGMN